MRTQRWLGIALALSLFAGCGFHLQGSNWPTEWSAYKLDYPPRDHDMPPVIAALDEAMRRRGLMPSDDPQFTLQIRSLIDRKSVAAIGSNGKAVEFELLRRVDFQIHSAGWHSPLYSVYADRRLSFDPTVVLAKEAEEERLRQGLSRDLIEQMLMLIEADLRTLPVTE